MHNRMNIIFLILIFASTTYARIINVPGDSLAIQAGIDGAENGDTVLIHPGTYVENITINNKHIVVGSLFLTTQDESYLSSTIINGNNSGSVVTFSDIYNTNNNYAMRSSPNGGMFRVDDNNALDVTGDFTVEAWVYINDASSSSKFIADRAGEWQLFIISSSVRFDLNGGSLITTGVLSQNEWHHIAVVRAGSRTLIFADGVKMAGDDLAMTDGNTPCCINGQDSWFSSTPTSLFDELKFSNASIYDTTGFIPTPFAPPGIDTNTIFYFQFEDTTELPPQDDGPLSLYTTNGQTDGTNLLEAVNYVTSPAGLPLNHGIYSSKLCGLTLINGNSPEGGGIHISNSSGQIISNVIVSGNYAGPDGHGGGIYIDTSDLILTNVNISGNSVDADGQGSGIYCDNYCNLTLHNMTIVDNSSQYGTGIYCGSSCDIIILNSILWNPNDTQIYNNESNNIAVSHSCIKSGQAGIQFNESGNLDWLNGNIQTYPNFINISNGNYYLSDSSTCIGAGIDSIHIENTWYYTPTTDICGSPRPNPVGSNPDIGAYENPLAAPLHNSFIHVATTGYDIGSIGLTSAPFKHIQTAIDYAQDGDTVLVRPDTYVENINFNGKNIVVGSLFLTTQDTSYISSTIIDGNQNGSVVTFENSEDTTCTLTGFTIQNGFTSEYGGGIYIDGASVKLSNLYVNNNIVNGGTDGGGIGIKYSNSILDQLVVYNNYGSGILLEESGGIVRNSIVRNNEGESWGTGIKLNQSNTLIENVIVRDNYTNSEYDRFALDGWASYPTIRNVLVTENDGGGLKIRGNLNTSFTSIIQNVTITNNIGDGLVIGDVNTIITNSIVWGNSVDNVLISGGTQDHEVHIAHNNFEGGQSAIVDDAYNGYIYWLGGNIYQSPLFIESGQNYQLSDHSPCIGAGVNQTTIADTLLVVPANDIVDNPRPNPDGSNPDMGAYESPLASQYPLATVIRDGLGDDLNWTNSASILSANWDPFIDDSTVTYECAIGIGDSAINEFLDWTITGADTFASLSGLSLSSGTTYFISLRGTDIHNQMSDTITTDGILVDLIDPMIGELWDGDVGGDIDWQGSTSEYSIYWTGSDSRVIANYQYCLGNTPGDSNTYAWTDNGTTTSITISGLSLVAGDSYYASIRAVDEAGNWSGIMSTDGVTIDGTVPVSGQVFDDLNGTGEFYANTDSLIFNWSGFYDEHSGIDHYELAIGISPGTDDLYNWASTELDTIFNVTGLSLNDGITYYCSVRAIDLGDNQSTAASSDGLTIDISGPVGGLVSDGTTEDIDWSNNQVSLSGHWQHFSDDGAGLDHYEYSVGSQAAGTDIKDWTIVGQDTFLTVDYLGLPTSGNSYYLNIRAFDQIGNVSSTYSSDGVTMDFTSPFIGMLWNGGYEEEFDYCRSLDSLMLSASPIYDYDSGLKDYRFALSTTVGDSDIAAWTTGELNINDSTAYIIFKDLSLVEGESYYGSFRASDNAGNRSSLTAGFGIIPDITPPTPGSVNDGKAEELAYSTSDSTAAANWSGFTDNLSGISYYEYALGTQAGGVDIVPFTDCGLLTTIEAIGLSLDHGQSYYFSVRATDLVGHSSDIASSNGFVVDKYAGPPTVTIITPTPFELAQSMNDISISLELSEPIQAHTITIGNYDNSGYTYVDNYLSTPPRIEISLTGSLPYADTLMVMLTEFEDLVGLAGDTVKIEYYMPYLADYNHDWIIDVLDLAEFASNWTSDELTGELGPVTGDVPYFTLIPDSAFTIRDVMAFTRMWNWSHQTQPPAMLASIGSFGEQPVIEQQGTNVLLKLPETAEAGQVVIKYQGITTDINCSTEDGTANRILLKNKDVESSRLLVEYAYISKSSAKSITLDTKALSKANSTITVHYTLYSENQKVVSQGSQDVVLVAVPEQFALHQNYPNPFNPITTIQYDLPEAGNLKLAIYDILGREVIELANGYQEAGYKSIQWNGRNKSGQLVSAGMYFYAIEAGKHSAIRKMVLLK